MKSYFIFAIVLTVAYIVYYAVIIVHDLYGKKGAGKMQEEVFDLGEPDDEESVAVTENETGFEVGSNAYETETADADRSAVPQAEAANTGISTQEKLERLKAKAEERMEESVRWSQEAGWTAAPKWSGNPSKNDCEMPKATRILCVLCLIPCAALAKSGSVDYSWGADALASMHDFVVTMMLYVLYVCYAVTSVFAVIAALQIYIKMNTGEEGIAKSIVSLLGACLFIIGASIVFPAFFGYRI